LYWISSCDMIILIEIKKTKNIERSYSVEKNFWCAIKDRANSHRVYLYRILILLLAMGITQCLIASKVFFDWITSLRYSKLTKIIAYFLDKLYPLNLYFNAHKVVNMLTKKSSCFIFCVIINAQKTIGLLEYTYPR